MSFDWREPQISFKLCILNYFNCSEQNLSIVRFVENLLET